MLQAGLLAHPVLAAFPFHYQFNSGGVCQNVCWIYSCGYSSRFSRDSLFTPIRKNLTGEPEIARQIYLFFLIFTEPHKIHFLRSDDKIFLLAKMGTFISAPAQMPELSAKKRIQLFS
jgi:hypothetical protein